MKTMELMEGEYLGLLALAVLLYIVLGTLWDMLKIKLNGGKVKW